jgi:hypothetical protein
MKTVEINFQIKFLDLGSGISCFRMRCVFETEIQLMSEY